VLPTWSRLDGRRETDVVDTIDSVGLGGRSGIEGLGIADSGVDEALAAGDRACRTSREVFRTLREDAEPLIVARRRRRSSKGASPPDIRLNLDGLRIGVHVEDERLDDKEGMLVLLATISRFFTFRKTVCGTTPSF